MKTNDVPKKSASVDSIGRALPPFGVIVPTRKKVSASSRLEAIMYIRFPSGEKATS